MIKEIEFDYKGGKAYARIRQAGVCFQYNWRYKIDGIEYGNASEWPENPGDDSIIRITKINIDKLINQVKK